MAPCVPDRANLDGLEARWAARWEADGVYRFDRSRSRDEVFSIDTPPPTVSGSLHVGHIFSYTHTDTVARFWRMRGKAVFYPMGWDDNGVPTERRVQNYFGVRCDPSLPFDPDFRPPRNGEGKSDGPPVACSRPNFVELCRRLTAEDEKAFEHLWRTLGLSVDWSLGYATIGERAQRVSQRAFLGLVRRGLAYQAEAPTLWDVDFATAVAQAELEDREVPGAYHRLAFDLVGTSRSIEIETTRPELLAACVALVVHPDDERYRPLVGATVRTPLFGVDVPVIAHPAAEPDKGTGAAMVCTFGDLTDVVWWRERSLDVRPIIGRDGRLLPVPWGAPGWESVDPTRAALAYDKLVGLRAEQARKVVVDELRAAGALVGEPRPIRHFVKFFEKGERPLEIVTSRQWFIRVMDLAPELAARGRELAWHPPFMQHRYQSWVEGLAGDWNVSRQRFFGCPFPVWYPLDDEGQPRYDQPLLAEEGRLPVDPSTDCPTGFAPSQRGEPGGFMGDPDVMDTWATSSLTPDIAGGFVDDPDLFERVYPMDVRPQAHEIIRTWLFTSVLRAHLDHGCLPWHHAAISGWVLDPDRKKMSKSKGNVVTPLPLLERHGADAVRYWAASGRPGTDTAFDEGQMRVGRRLATKVLNAGRFALTRVLDDDAGGPLPGEWVTSPSEAVDRALLKSLGGVVAEATAAFEQWDYARALERTEAFFWRWCDDYLELAKNRAYGERGPEPARSGRLTLAVATDTLLRLFAPFLPFATEEVWSWWREGSIHRSPWPSAAVLEQLAGPEADERVLDVAASVLASVRRAKTEARRSLRALVDLAVVEGPPELLALVERCQDDLVEAGQLRELRLVAADSDQLSVTVRLAEEQGDPARKDQGGHDRETLTGGS